jgi:cation diffusion facilitator CzcD-associated flavoprotein CzcO
MPTPTPSAPAEHFDVLIVGAGLSGVAACCHILAKCPNTTFAVVEARDNIGGTWDLFRYPGARSDSDMFTFSYSFRPWRKAKAIVDAPCILQYIRDTAREHGIVDKIRFKHRVKRASWSSTAARWTIEAERGESREPVAYVCVFVLLFSGSYVF